MEKLKSLLQVPALVLRMLGVALAALCRALFGELDWQAPGWAWRLRDVLSSLAARIRARPGRSALVLAGSLALGAGGWAGWQWWKNLPRPVEATFTVTAPAPTCYDCEKDRAPKPMLVTFSDSVAPLESAGKDIDANAAGIALSPRLDGTWHWVDDRVLRFQPGQDWAIGGEYTVTLPEKGFIAEHRQLAEYEFTFRTAPFTARIANSEFYQDPVNAGDKKFVVTLRFSHPVDTASLERNLRLSLFNHVSSWQETELDAPKYTVTYDKFKLNAYVHSAALDVPAKEGRAEVVVDKGVHAIRPGNETEEVLSASVKVPGLYSLTVDDLRLQIVRDERDEPRQALMLSTAYSVLEKDIAPRVHAWVLPLRHPDAKRQAEWERGSRNKPFAWGENDVTPAVLASSAPMPLEYVPNERDHVEQHAFRHAADPGRYVYVRVDKGMVSFGGYRLAEDADAALRVPDYPKELRIAQQGALLALSGQHKLSLFTRDVAGVRVDIGRLLPNQLQHLVTQASGDLANPRFDRWGFDETNLTERYTQTITLPTLRPGEPHYEVLDIDQYLSHAGASRQGIFFLRVSPWNPRRGHGTDGMVAPADDSAGSYGGEAGDSRMIVVTDLGMLVKRNVAGEQDVFVQSIHGGEPAAGVTVEVIGRNGEAVLSRETDADGHVRFPALGTFRNERQPVLYLARRGSDMSFLPVEGGDRLLDVSRFDVGGVSTTPDAATLSAYLFSDRGIYRPGDEIRGAAIIKTQDWRKLPQGLPLELQVTDPRGVVVKREAIRLSASGFEEFRYQTREASPTGSYTARIHAVKNDEQQVLLGSVTLNVQEFQPDRLKMSAHFTTEQAEGWVKPDDLKARIDLQNLFGTPAQGRRVTAALTLTPAFPKFSRYADYEFRDPQAAKEGYDERLADQKTDDNGEALFDLNLQRYARATYRLAIVTQGYEADGGRGVSAEAAQLVSSLPYLVGWKADGDLNYIARGAERKLRFLAIGPTLAPLAVPGLRLQHIERKYVSVLIRQGNGTYKYESRLKEAKLGEQPFSIAAGGTALPIDAATPGNFSAVVVDEAGQVYARVDYTVAGQANLTRTLDRNAELQIVLDRQDYAPGDEIRLQVNAPYTGAGLITIERDRVYSWKWFRTTTTASEQTIRLPEGIEGNAYVSVSFVRDPGSEEIFTSPLSWGVQPFSIALDRRRAEVTLDAPATVKPGELLTLKYRTPTAARIAVFAVDEGILQVAGYRTPDPLAHFFRKRALDVRTRQILDLVLPEFRAAMLAAPGGDAGAAIGRHLNPFRRKTDKPVAWWSGVVEAGPEARELQWRVPDYFNGSLRVMAVAVSEGSVGVAERKTTVRGDFVLSPNAPLTVTPGDEFDVSVGVANNVAGSGANAAVAVTLSPSAHFQVVGAKQQSVVIGELRESSVRFRVKTLDLPGSATLAFSAATGGKTGKLAATVSVRPANPFSTRLQAGTWKGKADIDVRRDFYADFRREELSVSTVPLALAHGLSAYLGNYPYSCTEQLVSMAVPALVLSSRPEFGYLRKQPGATIAGLVDELRMRQNSDGAYRYWAGGVQVEEFASLYAQHVLLEAADHEVIVPRDLVNNGNTYLRQIAARDGNDIGDERQSAYAIYLLARQGQLAANEAAALQKRLETRYAKSWRQDVVAAWLAGAYQLMRQDVLANQAIDRVPAGLGRRSDRWYGAMVTDAVYLYIVSRHFPSRLKDLPPTLLDGLAQSIRKGEYQSLGAATTVMALDAYASAVLPAAGTSMSATLVREDRREQALPLPAGLFPRASLPPESALLRLANDGPVQGFYLVTQAGFERGLPKDAIRQSMEIIREYTDVAGKPLTQVTMGDEVVVHVKYRAIDRAGIDDAVLVDLLPGGFEPVLPQRATAAEPVSREYHGDEGYEGDGEYEGYEDEAESAPACDCGLLWNWDAASVDYVDTREDRVVVYTRASTALREFTYRIKATNVGSFVVPPAYGESMYEPQVKARSLAGRIQVVRP